MVTPIRRRLGSSVLRDRVITGVALMLGLFVVVTVLSHLLLPGGILGNRLPAQSWEGSTSSPVLFGQIFLFNLISVVVIALASLFASRPRAEEPYLSAGWLAFFTLVTINAVVLGTWSFSVAQAPPDLATRLIGIVDLTRRAALWEMTGQLLSCAALAQVALVRTTGKATETRRLRAARLTGHERIVLLAGLVLMLVGAAIEAFAINAT